MPLYLRRAAVALALLAATSCTVKNSTPPPLTGPSGLALTLNVNAIPDSLSQDGGSQSSVRVTAIGPDGKGLASLPLRLDMVVGGVAQDYGTLSARSIVTNSDGVATAVYTAPPSPVNGVFGTCSGLPGNCVSIVATPTSTNFTTANPEQVQIRLVPIGVILPPASQPTAAFTISPTPVNFNIPSTFDASTSCGGPLSGSVCNSSSAITNYAWNFGDGASGSGMVINHTYVASTSPGNSYNVTLTVTNDRGVSTSTTQAVKVDASPAPSGDWVFSPLQPAVNDVVFFNATGVKPAAGHNINQFSWDFGDGTSAGGVQTTHKYSVSATYTVVLTVVDDAGQKTVIPKTITVGSGNPVPSCTASPASGSPGVIVTFNASNTQLFSGAVVTAYQWNFGDPSSGAANTSTLGPITTHQFNFVGARTISLTVIDSLGRSGTGACSATIS